MTQHFGCLIFVFLVACRLECFCGLKKESIRSYWDWLRQSVHQWNDLLGGGIGMTRENEWFDEFYV